MKKAFWPFTKSSYKSDSMPYKHYRTYKNLNRKTHQIKKKYTECKIRKDDFLSLVIHLQWTMRSFWLFEESRLSYGEKDDTCECCCFYATQKRDIFWRPCLATASWHLEKGGGWLLPLLTMWMSDAKMSHSNTEMWRNKHACSHKPKLFCMRLVTHLLISR